MSTLPERIEWILAHRRMPTGGEWTARGLSAAAGLSPAYVGLLRRGAVTAPRLDGLQAIAAAAQVSLAWLSAGTGNPDGDDPSAPSTTDDSTPIMRNVPGWAEVLEHDKAANPGIEEVYWDRATTSAPFIVFGPAQPGDALKLARLAKSLGSPERMTQMLREREERIKVLEAQLEEQRAEQKRIEAGGAPKKRTRRGGA